MSPVALLVPYCLLIVLASLAGGWLPLVVPLTHRRLQFLLSFVSGVMLGAALLHLMPHAAMEYASAGGTGQGHGALGPVAGWMLGGFLAMFFIERFFCFHHHEAETASGPGGGHAHDLTWTGAAIGLTLHSLTAGVALGAAVKAQTHDAAVAWSAGLGTLLAIVLHKPFDSMTLGTLLAARGGSPRLRHAVNFGFGLVVPAGVVLFFLGADAASDTRVVGAALAFSAGTFLCISLSDLLPELQFHQHDRFRLSAALLAGLAIAWGTSMLEGRVHEADEHAALVTPPEATASPAVAARRRSTTLSGGRPGPAAPAAGGAPTMPASTVEHLTGSGR